MCFRFLLAEPATKWNPLSVEDYCGYYERYEENLNDGAELVIANGSVSGEVKLCQT